MSRRNRKEKEVKNPLAIILAFLFLYAWAKISSCFDGDNDDTEQVKIQEEVAESTPVVNETVDEVIIEEETDNELASATSTPTTAELTEEEYKSICEELWYDEIFFSKDDLEGKYVKLDLFVEEARFFTIDAMMAWTIPKVLADNNVQRDFYKCGVARKDEQGYVGGQIDMVFSNDYEYSASDMTLGDQLVVYGEIVLYSTTTIDGYNYCLIIPHYVENNGQ